MSQIKYYCPNFYCENGLCDSGAQEPWGDWISVPCYACKGKGYMNDADKEDAGGDCGELLPMNNYEVNLKEKS